MKGGYDAFSHAKREVDRWAQAQVVSECPLCQAPASSESLTVYRAGEAWERTVLRCQRKPQTGVPRCRAVVLDLPAAGAPDAVAVLARAQALHGGPRKSRRPGQEAPRPAPRPRRRLAWMASSSGGMPCQVPERERTARGVLLPRGQQAWRPGDVEHEVADWFEREEARMGNRTGQVGKVERAEMVRLVEEGLSVDDVAERCRRSGECVRKALAKAKASGEWPGRLWPERLRPKKAPAAAKRAAGPAKVTEPGRVIERIGQLREIYLALLESEGPEGTREIREFSWGWAWRNHQQGVA